MQTETIFGYLRAIPFRPFRLLMNSGKTFDVRHPDFLRVGKDSLVFFYANTPDEPYDHWDTVGLLLIERIEHLTPVRLT